MTFLPRENFDGNWQISMSEIPFLDEGCTKGSYNVLSARLLGFTYAEYLKYCIAKHSGVLRKSSGYPYCIFKNKSDCSNLCNLLNKEWKKVENFMKEK